MKFELKAIDVDFYYYMMSHKTSKIKVRKFQQNAIIES